MILVIGGSGSGKSEFAEELAVSIGSENRIYIATMKPFDEECLQKIAKHHEMRRNKGFSTIECYGQLNHKIIKEDSVVLLECMSNMLANLMFEEKLSQSEILRITEDTLLSLDQKVKGLIVVTNQIMEDGEPEDKLTREYMRILGKINCMLAGYSKQVIEVVCSVPVYIKGNSHDNVE